MNDELKRLEDMVNALLVKLPEGHLPTPDKIREEIRRIRPVTPSVTDEQAEQLAKKLESKHGVAMDLGATLKEEHFQEWLERAKPHIESFYWDRYRDFLGELNFSGQVLAALDNITDSVLGLLENPAKEGKWDRRGMVIGHVQSGKTANYTGLMCKAADAGYKVIIVIAGIHNNLRQQTQGRIDEGFVGFDSSRLMQNRPESQRIVGAGRFDSSRRPAVFTNTLRDFDKATATSVGIPLKNLTEPAVFVIKKNSHTLRNLIDWLRDHNSRQGTSSIGEPLLLIDDEADNASINIKKGRDEVSRINGQIRQLLNLFDRSSYVGYTATPFANIFIDPDTDHETLRDDLFPRHFIRSLDPPDNYLSATRVFLDEERHFIRHIEDNEDILPLKHQIDHRVHSLPESLRTALRAFIVARAIRSARGQAHEHHSMVVNVSRFTAVQSQIRNEIHAFMDRIRSHVRVNGARPEVEALRDPEIRALRTVFDLEYPNGHDVPWSEIQALLWKSTSAVRVIEINSRATGALNYSEHLETGLNVVAVGGFSLSRGLTLEGLTISYFLRNSIMYDTLMQMCRWLGYRTGYDDLCRIWMPEEAEGWYAHIADSIEELRHELRRMEAANATPQEFGLKVRSHPDTLIVTARNKMGSGLPLTVSIGLANRFIETTVLRRDAQSLHANRDATIRLVNNLRSAGLAPEDGERVPTGRLVRDAPVEVVQHFLSAFRNHEGSHLTDTGPVQRHIEQRAAIELRDWDIFFPSVATPPAGTLVDRSLGFEIACQRRRAGRGSDRYTLTLNNKRVSSRGVEKIGLTDEEADQVEEEYRQKEGGGRAGNSKFPDYIYRNIRRKPLLIVHLLAIGEANEDLTSTDPMVAWSISFPRTTLEEEKVEYVVNTTWFRERYREEDEEEAAGDDD